MGDALKKVQPGQRVAIREQALETIIHAASNFFHCWQSGIMRGV